MVRKARDKNTFGTYYITQSGNESRNLFLDDNDKNKFLEILSKTKKKFDYKIYAYCISSDNFYKLIIYDNGSDISKIMKSINISYSMYVKCGKKLFNDRYKSFLIKDYHELINYTKKIHCYENKWNSYCDYIKDSNPTNNLLDSKDILNLFNYKNINPKKSYKEYINNNLDINDIICDRDIIFCKDNKNCITI